MTDDEKFMHQAIELSQRAVDHGNEPFGAVLVKDGKVVFTNENQIYTKHDFTFHAEAGLIRRFCAETGIADLSDYTLYSSCEPCFMCSSALSWAKVGRLVFGASDRQLGQLISEKGSDPTKIVFENMPHHPHVTAGVLADESLTVLRAYFTGHKKN